MERMRIKQVADFVGVHPDTIRYQEDRGTLPAPKRDHKGARYYSVEDMERIKKILFPMENGLAG